MSDKYMKDFNGEKIFCLEYDKETLRDMIIDKQEEIEYLEKEKDRLGSLFYERNEENIKLHHIIKEAREYIKDHTTHYTSYLGREHKVVPKIELQREAYDKLLEILDKVGEGNERNN